jgi:hypothetical protein
MPRSRAATALALAAALGAPAAARAQQAPWRTTPMVVWLDAPGQEALVGRFGATSAGSDLLVVNPATGAAEVRPYRALLSREPSAMALAPFSTFRTLRAGDLAQNGGDALADVARVGASGGQVQVAFGDAPGTLRTYAVPLPATNEAAAFLHLLPRAADVLVVPYNLYDYASASFTALDFDAAAAPSTFTRNWPLGASLHLDAKEHTVGQEELPRFEAAPLRLSAVARDLGIDDVALLGFRGVILLLHADDPTSPTLAGIRLGAPVEVGGNRSGAYSIVDPVPYLPPSIAYPGDVIGIAAADLNADGKLDLVLTQTLLGAVTQGAAVLIPGTGDPADFADWTQTPWQDLTRVAALGVVEPMLVRQVQLGDTPAVAIWDRGLAEVVVAWTDAATTTLRTWRAPAPGAFARDIRTVDVVGQTARDLVVVMDRTPEPAAVLVYPDVAGPALAWTGGSPGRALRGAPHRLEVSVDPAAATSVDWIEGAPTTAPRAACRDLTRCDLPVGCASPPSPFDVTVRAVDATGVFSELTARVPVDELALALALQGASPDRLTLAPGGTAADLVATAATGCGTVTLVGPWAGAAGIAATDVAIPSGFRRHLAIGEAAYPALLADPSGVATLATDDPAAAVTTASIRLAVDGVGLVVATHAADRASLGEGELAVLRTVLTSRIGAALPRVRVRDMLVGLSPAGAPRVTGATAAAVGADGAEVVLDALPAAPAQVVIELPVRVLATRGTSSVEAWSSGDARLTPPATAGTALAARPGCGCGGGAAPGAVAGLVFVAVGRSLRRACGRRSSHPPDPSARPT